MSHHPPTKILVGVDFSPESDAAVGHAMAVARSSGAEVVLLHACTVPEPPAVLGDYAPPALGDYRARIDADVAADRERLEDLRVRLSGQGVTVSHMVADGFPDTTITHVAREIGADLTVVGTHGRTGLKWLFLGSVAQRVVRLADSDVLVARGQPVLGGYRRICVATDFSPIAERGLEAALDLAHIGAEVDVVHFWHLAPRLGFYEPIRLASIEEWRGSLDAEMKAAGGRLIAAHRRPGVTLSFQSIFEPVLPGLQSFIEKGRYDLAVLGSHGRRGFRRFVLGSVAEEIARRAPCSVLVAHGADVEAIEAAA
jgi:nucleotide-binding universal stress UspA family protein